MSSPTPQAARERLVLTVSQLNREVRATLEGSFPLLWVEGEISNLARPASGHLYFSLKDGGAQVRCALFRNRGQGLRFRPDNGQQVLARGRVSLYEPRGDYQFIVDSLEEAGGEGALRRAFEELKRKLAAEGLFDAERKKPLPTLPRAIGVVTSPSGAAVRDILTVLRRRFPAIPVILYPTAVQGEGAAESIASQILTADARNEVDALIVGRGGGSLEDLQAFNEEVVARAIDACSIPTVSAVGHEIDFTIADFVADRRAPTPSAAAELLAPDRNEWLARLQREVNRLEAARRRWMEGRRQRIQWLDQRLERLHPGRRLEQRAQRLDELEGRLRRACAHRLSRHGGTLRELSARLARHLPSHRVERLRDRHGQLAGRLRGALEHLLERRGHRLAAAGRALEAVSPLATLSRGYAIVRRDDGRVIRASSEVVEGDRLEARLHRGRLTCRVETIHSPKEEKKEVRK
ncbi:exodeoxyribonuclease VII large subunit [Endothiovibrio diazotrophicus]